MQPGQNGYNGKNKQKPERGPFMTLNFYTLGVIYLIYSFLGWVGETIVATIKGKSFANRGAAAGPFCFVYGTTAVLLAAG